MIIFVYEFSIRVNNKTRTRTRRCYQKKKKKKITISDISWELDYLPQYKRARNRLDTSRTRNTRFFPPSFAAIIWCDARKARKQKWERTGSIFIASVTGRAQERREKRAGSLNDFCRRGEIGPKNNPAARCGSALIREKPGGGGKVEREAGGAFYAILFHGKQKLYNAIFQRFYCYTCT